MIGHSYIIYVRNIYTELHLSGKKYVGQDYLNPNVEILLGRYPNAVPSSYVLKKSFVCSSGTVVGCSNIVPLRLPAVLEAQL